MAKEHAISASNVNTGMISADTKPRITRKKLLAFTLASLMLISAVAMVYPSIVASADESVPASTEWLHTPPTGQREAVYTFNHWGENYLKNDKWNATDYAYGKTSANADISNLGHHGQFGVGSLRNSSVSNPTGLGVSDWLNGSSPPRGTYGEYGVRTDKFPYIYANNPNSGETQNLDAATTLNWICWTPYRMTGVIKNESMGRTGNDSQHAWHAWYVPHLGRGSAYSPGTAESGGYINATYYCTYLTGPEVTAVYGGTHYAQWFYGCPWHFVANANDGYYYEIQGKIQYSRQAAKAYLGYSGTGDARTWFNTNLATIETAWTKDWMWNGSEPKGGGKVTADPNATYGWANSYTNYEYDINLSGMFALKLLLDYTNSTANTLVVRVYCISWGMETVIMRMMEKCNATGYWLNNSAGPRGVGKNIRGSMIDYSEDLYWNITANPDRCNMEFRMVTTYRLTAWEDPSTAVFMGGWMLECFHTDYIGNGAGVIVAGTYWSYLSPFERYDPQLYTPDRTRMSAVPGTKRYQKNVSYWTTPIAKNFSKYECFIYDLNTSHWGMGNRDFCAINATWVSDGTARDATFLSDNIAKGNFTKNVYWGRLKLGDYCMPWNITKSRTARADVGGYDNLTQVLTISGGSRTSGGSVGWYAENSALGSKQMLSGRDYWTATGGTPTYKNGKVFARGMPFVMLDVVPVDNYKITFQNSTIMPNIPQKFKVQAINASGAVVDGTTAMMWGLWKSTTKYAWNGTVYLSSTNGNFLVNTTVGRTSGQWHNFTQADAGTWWSKITFTVNGAQTMTAKDRTNKTGTPRGDGNAISFTDIQTRKAVYVGVNSGPVVAISTPVADPYYTKATPLTMTGTATDADGVSNVSWTNRQGGSGACTGTTSWSASIPLVAGLNNITICAADPYGNFGRDWKNVYYDPTAPTCTIVTPATSPIYVATQPYTAMAGTASDNIAVTSVAWKNMLTGGSGPASGTTSWTIASITLSAGSNLIYVNASDAAGNIGSDSTTIVYDPTAPTCTIVTPGVDPLYVGSQPYTAMAGTASDNIGVTSVTWVSDQGPSGTATGTTSWTIASITLSAGSNVITVTAHDATGNIGTDVTTIIFDAIAPTCTIVTPATSPIYVATQPYTAMAGTASDNIAVTSVTWVNSLGGFGDATGTDSWTIASIALSAGSNVITVTAHDATGNIGTDVTTIIYDPTAPTCTIVTPATSPIYVGSQPYTAMAGTASDNIAVTSVTWVSDQGPSGTASGTDSWTIASIALSAGSNVITVTAHDAAGNTGTDVTTIIYDPTAPTCTIVTPASDPLYVVDTPYTAMAGTASDNIGVTSVTWVSDQGPSGTASGTDSWTIPSITLTAGSNVITVTAHDAAGNIGTDVTTIIYDPTAPTCTITTPGSSPIYVMTQPYLEMAGTASDNIGVTSVTWVSDQGPSGTASGTDSWTIASIALSAGSNVITVTAHDAAGNTGTDVTTIIYDPTAPICTIVTPASDPYYTGSNTVDVDGTASDNIAVTSVTWSNDRGGSGTATGTTSWSITGIVLATGSNIITVDAWDQAGNYGSDTITVVYSPWTVISIAGDSDMATWASNNGWAGDGSSGNPYQITAYDIDATGENYGINISGTTVYFAISSTNVSNAAKAGVRLDNVDHAALSAVNCSDNKEGILVMNSADVSIDGSTVWSNDFNGTYAEGCAGVTITDMVAKLNTYNGIYLKTCTGVSVTGGTVQSNGRSGVYLTACPDGVVSGTDVSLSTMFGVFIKDSDRVNVTGVSSSSNGYSGIYVSEGSGATVSGCTVASNTRAGINVEYADYTTVDRCEVTGSGWMGIDVRYSYGVEVSNNVVTTSTQSGIYVNSATDTMIVNNDVSDNTQSGIYLYSTANPTVQGGNTTLNHNNGISVGGTTSSADIIGVNATSNVVAGIDVKGTTTTTITSCNSSSNSRGIYATSASSLSIVDCDVWSNGAYGGLYLSSCAGTTVQGGTVSANGWAGMYIVSCTGQTTINSVNVTTNSYDGIYSKLTNYVSVTGSLVSGNSQYGIRVETGTTIVISGCTVSSNTKTGIYLVSCTYVAISGCTVQSNLAYGIALTSCKGTDITGSNISLNTNDGIFAYACTNGNITWNDLYKNIRGVYLSAATTGYNVHHNNFMSNTYAPQAYDPGTGNMWDDGANGNHWSNWLSSLPYPVPPNKQDRYPSITEW